MSETLTPKLPEILEKEASSEKDSDKKEKALEALKKVGVIEKNDRDVIVDLAKLKTIRLREEGLEKEFKDLGLGTGKIEVLSKVFEGRKVTSKEDWAEYLRKRDAGVTVELSKKKLFYSPQTAQEAIDPEAIKQADFYLGPWETSPTRPDKYPGLENTDLSFSEVAAAAVIYHPRYGAGRREDDGKLYVTFTDGTRRPISSEFFQGRSFRPGGISNPREYVAEQLPHLVQSAILKPEDFQISSFGSTAEKYRIQKIVQQNGMIMLNRTLHYIGKEYAGMNAYQLTSSLGAIVSGELGSEKLEATFRISNPPVGERRGYRIAKKNEVDTKKFEPENSSGELGEIAINFSKFLRVSNQISREYGINLTGLSLPEQQRALVLNQEWGGRQEYRDFAKKTGEAGLKTLISVSYDPEKIKQVFALGKNNKATEIFSEYNALRDLASSFVAEVGSGAENSASIYQAILSRAEGILLANQQLVGQKMSDKVNLLRSYNRNVAALLEERFGFSINKPNKEAVINQLERQSEPNIVGYLETSFENIFAQEIRAQKGQSTTQEIEKTKQFYSETGETLYSEASETTGDTELERTRLETFLQGFDIRGTILDAGSSDGERITSWIASRHPESRFIGIDLETGNPSQQTNTEYLRGSFTQIPLADQSVEAIYSVWSPINDITKREDQIAFIREFSRVTKTEGMLFLDVPYLSPFFHNSWYQEAVKYHKEHPQVPLGTINAAFKTKDGQTASKEFYIYFAKELEKLLNDAGFEILSQIKEKDIASAKQVESEVESQESGSKQKEQKSPLSAPVWVTKSGRPRFTLIAKKTGILRENLEFLT